MQLFPLMPEILEKGDLSDLVAAIRSFAVSLLRSYPSNDLRQTDDLIQRLRRQNYYFYRRARQEKTKALRNVQIKLSREIAAQIRVIRKSRNQPDQYRAALGIIIRYTTPLSRRELLEKGIAIGGGSFLAGLLGKASKAEAAAKSRIREYFGPINNRRPNISSTKWIILHMTEGYDNGLELIKKQGTAHYVIATNGIIYQTVKDDLVAKHAGRSWWDGKKELNNYSLGIEVVGFWERGLTSQQYDALKYLIMVLQKRYGIHDKKVIPHAMVSYFIYKGISYRPRKTCGTLFARKPVRTRLGLTSKPKYDLEVKLGKLKIGNKKAYEALWGPASGGREDLPIPDQENEIQIIGRDGDTAYSIAGSNWNKKDTLYIFPKGTILNGTELVKPKIQKVYSINPKILPQGTKILVGYIYGGKIEPSRTAYSIAKELWNHPSTIYYQIKDQKIITGDDIDPGQIPQETIVFFRD